MNIFEGLNSRIRGKGRMYGGGQRILTNEKCVWAVAQLIIVPKSSTQYRLTRAGNVTEEN